jgi:hypothetical protein
VVLRKRQAGRLGQRQVEGGMAVADGRGGAGRRQLLLAVLAQRLARTVARRLVGALVHHHQRLIHEVPQQVARIADVDPVARTDRLGRLQGEATGEHRQPVEERPLRLGQ